MTQVILLSPSFSVLHIYYSYVGLSFKLSCQKIVDCVLREYVFHKINNV